MGLTWLEAAERLSISLYVLVITGLLVATVVRALRGSPAPTSGEISDEQGTIAGALQSRSPRPLLRAHLSRLLFEYVGNVDPPWPEEPDRSGPMERRRNLTARLHLDWMKDQMRVRGYSAGERERFLEDLRQDARWEGEGVASDETNDRRHHDSPPG